ncbi:hypothetical protein HDU97_000615 [Phlyctochytrium planicorne]|nr:hypothetical protein HDU97_000615 [Phlyctochytrium planicorne]
MIVLFNKAERLLHAIIFHYSQRRKKTIVGVMTFARKPTRKDKEDGADVEDFLDEFATRQKVSVSRPRTLIGQNGVEVKELAVTAFASDKPMRSATVKSAMSRSTQRLSSPPSSEYAQPQDPQSAHLSVNIHMPDTEQDQAGSSFVSTSRNKNLSANSQADASIGQPSTEPPTSSVLAFQPVPFGAFYGFVRIGQMVADWSAICGAILMILIFTSTGPNREFSFFYYTVEVFELLVVRFLPLLGITMVADTLTLWAETKLYEFRIEESMRECEDCPLLFASYYYFCLVIVAGFGAYVLADSGYLFEDPDEVLKRKKLAVSMHSPNLVDDDMAALAFARDRPTIANTLKQARNSTVPAKTASKKVHPAPPPDDGPSPKTIEVDLQDHIIEDVSSLPAFESGPISLPSQKESLATVASNFVPVRSGVFYGFLRVGEIAAEWSSICIAVLTVLIFTSTGPNRNFSYFYYTVDVGELLVVRFPSLLLAMIVADTILLWVETKLYGSQSSPAKMMRIDQWAKKIKIVAKPMQACIGLVALRAALITIPTALLVLRSKSVRENEWAVKAFAPKELATTENATSNAPLRHHVKKDAIMAKSLSSKSEVTVEVDIAADPKVIEAHGEKNFLTAASSPNESRAAAPDEKAANSTSFVPVRFGAFYGFLKVGHMAADWASICVAILTVLIFTSTGPNRAFSYFYYTVEVGELLGVRLPSLLLFNIAFDTVTLWIETKLYGFDMVESMADCRDCPLRFMSFLYFWFVTAAGFGSYVLADSGFLFGESAYIPGRM